MTATTQLEAPAGDTKLETRREAALATRTFEARLVARMQRGDEEAYEVLIRQYGGRLLSVARRICSNEEDAADAVQDTYLQAFRAVASFRGDAQLGTWLHRIVVNASLMKLRTRKRRPEVEMEALLPVFDKDGRRFEPEDTKGSAASACLESLEAREQVCLCIAQLPQAYREVIQLRDLDGLDTARAAQALGISENAAKVRLHRARQALAELLRRLGL